MGGRAQRIREHEVRELEEPDQTFPGFRAYYILREMRAVEVIRNAPGSDT